MRISSRSPSRNGWGGAEAATLRVVEVSDQLARPWTEFVASRADATQYHDYRWRGVIERAFARETHYLAANSASGAIEGVLPLARLRSAVFGDFLVSLPYFNYGGVLAATEDARDALLAAAASLGERLGVDHVELRHTADFWPQMPKRTDKVAMVRALPRDAATLARELGTKIRAQIRRPVKEGATVRFGGLDLVDDFYRVFARNMRDLGTPVYSKRFFAEIVRTFPLEASIAVVDLHGSPVAAGFLLRNRRHVEIPWAASLREANRLGVNMFLYGSVLDWCIDQGAESFDFGRSTEDSGTYRFKRQWGAKPVPLYWHYWLPQGRDVPQVRPDNPRYRILVAAWQRVPVPVANLIGPHIVKNLP